MSMSMRHGRHDHNQSSRLDLDLDHDSRGSNSSQHLDQIAESRLNEHDAFSLSSASSLASTAEAEAEGTTDVDQHRQKKQHPHGKNGNRRNMKRESTHSTIDTSSSSRIGEGAGKKLVKIKLQDPGQSSAEPTVVTVAMNVMQINQNSEGMHDLSLGVGKQIQLCQQNSMELGRDAAAADEGGAVDILWHTLQKHDEEVWQPPLKISKDDKRRPSSDRDLQRKLSQSSIPRTDSSEPSVPSTASEKLEPSEKSLSPVKDLEPFTIPTIISSTIVKSSPTEKVGLAFRKAPGAVVVEKIVAGSLFDGTDLRKGFECLSINGHRLRSARRAAEIVGASGSKLTLLASNAPRPPGTMHTIISLNNCSGSMTIGANCALGMHFKMKNNLVKLSKLDADSAIRSTSMKTGDYVLAINGSVVGSVSKAVEQISESNDDLVILYFNMKQLRVHLVDKIIGEMWKKEWLSGYDECVIVQPGKGPSNPVTLRFKEGGMCELRDENSENPTNHPLSSVDKTLNNGIRCVLSAIREGVQLETTDDVQDEKSNDGSGSLIGELGKLSEMYKEGLLTKDEFKAMKSKLLYR